MSNDQNLLEVTVFFQLAKCARRALVPFRKKGEALEEKVRSFAKYLMIHPRTTRAFT